MKKATRSARHIVHTANGRTTKPLTRARIAELHSAGKVPPDSQVQEVGSELLMPLNVFLEETLQQVRQPVFPEPEPMAMPETDSEASTLPEVKFVPTEPTSTSTDRQRRKPRTSVIFSGFNIPQTGVAATRDYLRSKLWWIELWLKFVNVISTFIVVCWLWLLTTLVFKLVGNTDFGEGFVWGDFLRANFALLRAAGIVTVLWVMLEIFEAVLRLVPASIRYWIETTEEARLRAG